LLLLQLSGYEATTKKAESIFIRPENRVCNPFSSSGPLALRILPIIICIAVVSAS